MSTKKKVRNWVPPMWKPCEQLNFFDAIVLGKETSQVIYSQRFSLFHQLCASILQIKHLCAKVHQVMSMHSSQHGCTVQEENMAPRRNSEWPNQEKQRQILLPLNFLGKETFGCGKLEVSLYQTHYIHQLLCWNVSPGALCYRSFDNQKGSSNTIP